MGTLSRRDLLTAGAAFGLGCREPLPAKSAQRIVSISPSTTEMVFALGAGSRLVGRSRYCDFPEEAKRVEDVGGFADPSLERVITLGPSLVCGERGPAGEGFAQALEARGVAVYFPAIERYEHVRDAIGGLAKLIGSTEAAAPLVNKLDDMRELAAARRSGRAAVRVAFVFDWKPIVLAGKHSFPGSLLELVGAKNAFEESGLYPTISAEGFFAADPDVIIDGATHGDARLDPLEVHGALAELRAVKTGGLRVLPSARTLRPGPRLGEGLHELGELVFGPDWRRPR